MKDLYKEIPKATTRDLGSIIDFLKKAREVREGKTKKRREARKKFDQDIFMASLLNRLIELESNRVVAEMRKEKSKNPFKKFFRIK